MNFWAAACFLFCLCLCCADVLHPVQCNSDSKPRPYPWDNTPTAGSFSHSQGARYTISSSPHYCQCNSSWGYDFMSLNGTRNVDRICAQGCAMSSLSVFLASRSGHYQDPGTLNKWLRHHNGYVCDPDCDDLNLTAVHSLDSRISLHGYMRSFTLMDIVKWALLGWAPIIHVQNRTHFVLVTGYFVGADGKTPNGTLITRDSYYPRVTRDISEVTEVLLYSWNSTQ